MYRRQDEEVSLNRHIGVIGEQGDIKLHVISSSE